MDSIDLKQFRAMRKKAGVCRDCGKEDAYTMVGRLLCAECAEKDRLRHEQDRKDPVKYQKMLDSHNNMRNRRKIQGMCTLCGKSLPERWPYVTCDTCRARQKRYSEQARRRRGVPTWEERTSGKVCFICGAPQIKGLKVCAECKEHLDKHRPLRPKEGHVWRKQQVALPSK